MQSTLVQPRLRAPHSSLRSRRSAGSFTRQLRASAAGYDLDKIPGPSGVPVLGNALQFAAEDGHQKVVQWANNWPIYKFKLLNQVHIVVTDPVEITAILTPTPEYPLGFPKAFDPFYSALNELNTPLGTPSFFTDKDPKVWEAVRGGMDPAFTMDNVKKQFPMIRETINTVTDYLAKKAGAPVDIAEANLRIVVDVIYRYCWGVDLGARNFTDLPILKALPLTLKEITILGKDPIRKLKFKLLPFLPDAAAYEKAKQIVFQSMADLAKVVRATPLDAVEKGDVSPKAYLARVKSPQSGKLLTEDELAAHIAATIVGGAESSTQACSWALYEVARHPEVQAKIAAELDKAGLLWKPGKPGRQIELEDLQKLTYLQHAKQEAIRMHPPATLAPIRLVDKDYTFKNGWRVPAGTTVWTSILASQNTRYNFVDPDKFWPERYEQGDVAPVSGGCPHATIAGNTTGPAYFPFSRGPRNCIGRFLAGAMGPAMFASILSRFEVSVAPQMGSELDVKAKERNYLTLQIEGGTWLILKPRDK